MARARGAAAVEAAVSDDAVAAEEAALRMLRSAAQSAEQLRRRLRRRGFTGSAADAAVGRMQRLGYVDDAELAAAVARRTGTRGQGRARVAAALHARDIADEHIDAALASIDPASELDAAVRSARALWPRYAASERPGAAMRLAAALQRRGFAPAVVRQAVASLHRGDEEDLPAAE